MEAYIATTPIHSLAEHTYRVDSGPLTVFNSRRLVPLQMTRGHLRQMCTELDLKKFSERWSVFIVGREEVFAAVLEAHLHVGVKRAGVVRSATTCVAVIDAHG